MRNCYKMTTTTKNEILLLEPEKEGETPSTATSNIPQKIPFVPAQQIIKSINKLTP